MTAKTTVSVIMTSVPVAVSMWHALRTQGLYVIGATFAASDQQGL